MSGLSTYPGTKIKLGPKVFEITDEDIEKVLAIHPETRKMVRPASPSGDHPALTMLRDPRRKSLRSK